MRFANLIAEFDDIKVSDVEFTDSSLSGKITLSGHNIEKTFYLRFRYSENVRLNMNLGGLILTVPAINFTLFSKKLTLDFPVSDNDIDIIRKFVKINNREVFINKLARRRYEFFKKDYIPSESDVIADNVDGVTEVVGKQKFRDSYDIRSDPNNVAILSSGGKESLLSYGMLSEIGANTFEIFFNESGAHWMTAKTAYDAFLEEKKNTIKIWSNVDRFYRFCLRNMKAIDQNMIKRKTDTYPVQLFIFPVYIISSLPVLAKHGISSIVIGDEFDDPREMHDFNGFKHYYGIFDQSNDFNDIVSRYLGRKGFRAKVWSAVYPVTASVVEKILVERYPELFVLQRSCHSCRKVNGMIKPCGNCSKCLGIMLFVKAAGGRLQDIGYEDLTNDEILEKVARERMRLDSDELIMLQSALGKKPDDRVDRRHTQSVHILPGEPSSFSLIPDNFREPIKRIVSEYARDEYVLDGDRWVRNKHSARE